MNDGSCGTVYGFTDLFLGLITPNEPLNICSCGIKGRLLLKTVAMVMEFGSVVDKSYLSLFSPLISFRHGEHSIS